MRVLRMHLEKAFRVPMDSDASRAVNLDLVQRVSAHQRGGFGSESRRMALAQVYYTWLSGVHAATPPPLAFSPKLNQAQLTMWERLRPGDAVAIDWALFIERDAPRVLKGTVVSKHYSLSIKEAGTNNIHILARYDFDGRTEPHSIEDTWILSVQAAPASSSNHPPRATRTPATGEKMGALCSSTVCSACIRVTCSSRGSCCRTRAAGRRTNLPRGCTHQHRAMRARCRLPPESCRRGCCGPARGGKPGS